MKKLTRVAFVTSALLFCAGASAAMTSDTVMVGGAAMFPSKNIVENAVNSKDHTTLVAAVQAAGLVETLSGAGPFTVFAPTNAAFAALADLPQTRVAATSALAPVWPYATAGEYDLFTGRNAIVAPAITGVDFSWFQHLFSGGESLCRSSGHVYLCSVDPGRYVATFTPAVVTGNGHLVCGR